MYQVDRRLQIGFEYNPLAGEVNPLLNYMVQQETEHWPMINFGTSSDRIGTPPGPQGYYFTFAKTFASRVVPYISINYSEFEKGLTFPFGANIILNKNWVLLPMFDGARTHLLLTYRGERTSVSAMLIWTKHPGISYSWNF